MHSNWLIPLMLLAPLVGALVLFMLPRKAAASMGGKLAFVFALIPTLITVLLISRFNMAEGQAWQEMFRYNWIGQLGIHFTVGVDAMSLWLVALTVLITPVTMLDAMSKIKHRHNEFYAWMLLGYFAMIGIFVAQNVMLFYLFFEFSLIPTFFIIGIWGYSNRRKAAAKFFLYAFAGSIFILASLLYLAWAHYEQAGSLSFGLKALYHTGQSLPLEAQCFVFAGLLIGFAVKVPLFPLHTWMPLAITEAPSPGSVIIASFKIGAYGLLRFALPMLPLAVVHFTPVVAVLAIISILYGALISWVQRDMKCLMAYAVISHLGLCVLAMFALTTSGLTGSLMVMINQGLAAGALLLVMGMITQRYATRNLMDVSGLARRLPALGFFAGFFVIATVAVPGLNGFISEILSLVGTYVSGSPNHGGSLGPAYAIPAALGMVVGALYMLYWIGKVFFGPLQEPAVDDEGSSPMPPKDLSMAEWTALVPLAAATLFLGLYPGPVLRSLEPAMNNIKQNVLAGENGPPSLPIKTMASVMPVAAKSSLALLARPGK